MRDSYGTTTGGVIVKTGRFSEAQITRSCRKLISAAWWSMLFGSKEFRDFELEDGRERKCLEATTTESQKVTHQ